MSVVGPAASQCRGRVDAACTWDNSPCLGLSLLLSGCRMLLESDKEPLSGLRLLILGKVAGQGELNEDETEFEE